MTVIRDKDVVGYKLFRGDRPRKNGRASRWLHANHQDGFSGRKGDNAPMAIIEIVEESNRCRGREKARGTKKRSEEGPPDRPGRRRSQLTRPPSRRPLRPSSPRQLRRNRLKGGRGGREGALAAIGLASDEDVRPRAPESIGLTPLRAEVAEAAGLPKADCAGRRCLLRPKR